MQTKKPDCGCIDDKLSRRLAASGYALPDGQQTRSGKGNLTAGVRNFPCRAGWIISPVRLIWRPVSLIIGM
ncbi:MAG TPA: hypothetical protein GXX29_00820 [Firmicutes bacterium]|nr:hypothetical protein [Bacillota bacterium]